MVCGRLFGVSIVRYGASVTPCNQDGRSFPVGMWTLVKGKAYWTPNPLLSWTEDEQREHNIRAGYDCTKENDPA